MAKHHLIGGERRKEVLTCDVCAGAGVVDGSVTCPLVRIGGTVEVTNPGDPGYAEKRAALERSRQV